MTTEGVSRPRSFTVVAAKPGLYGFGRLTVEPGGVALDSWPFACRLVTQTRGPVVVVTARFQPPWWRTALILRGDKGLYGAALSSRDQARRVREALIQAGFEILERETRFLRLQRSSFSSITI
jgi:hypothetical protein